MSDSSSPSDNLNNFVAGLALLSAFLSAILYYRAYLPSVKFKELDDLLNETKSIYDQAEAENLLPTDPQALTRLKVWLRNLERSRAEIREETYRKTTPFAEYMALLRGLSRRIMKKIYQTKRLRAFIVTTSEEQRHRRRSDYQPPPTVLSSDDLEASVIESPDGEDSFLQISDHTTTLTTTTADETEHDHSDSPNQADDDIVVLIPQTLQRADTSLSASPTLVDEEQQTTKLSTRLSTLLWRVLIQMHVASPERLAGLGAPPNAADLSV